MHDCYYIDYSVYWLNLYHHTHKFWADISFGLLRQGRMAQTLIRLVGKYFWVKSSGGSRFNPNYKLESVVMVNIPFTYHHHHHHVVPLAWISLTLSRHFSQSFIAIGRSSGLHPVSSQSCWMYVQAGRPAFTLPYVKSIGVHHLWARPCFSSSVLHVWFV